MSRAVITKSLLTSIANAIRAKTGGSAQLTPAQMATAIGTIQGSVPEFLISDSGYPSSYAWPYATMKIGQFMRMFSPMVATPFFTSFDFGSLAAVPGYAMCIGTSGSAYASYDKLQSVSGSSVLTLGEYAFGGRAHLTAMNFPQLQEIKVGALSHAGITTLHSSTITTIESSACESAYLTTVALSALDNIGSDAFYYCTRLTRSELGGTYRTLQRTFFYCTALEYVDLSSQSLGTISSGTFQNCSALNTLVIRRTDAVVTLASTGAFTRSGITASTGAIYVPDDLVDSYKAATNWSTYASQIKPISELPAASNE